MIYILGKRLFVRPINGIMQAEALLEVSGILTETKNNRLSSRVGIKRKQVELTPFKNLPAYVIVVEFSVPKGKIIKL